MQQQFDVAGVITVNPRVTFAVTQRNLMESLIRLSGFPVECDMSPYWEQSIQRAIVRALKHGRKYLLFFDGDSAWDTNDLLDLYRIIEANPYMDAIMPVQADRNSVKPLCHDWLRGHFGIDYDNKAPITQIPHGHFGLTLIRSEAFKRMPKPWFQGIPGRTGEWELEDGKRDPDTYFWMKFNECGLKAFRANYTVVGHMELHVRWQRGGEVVAQTVMDFVQNGKPYALRGPHDGELPADAKTSSEMGVIKAGRTMKAGMMPGDVVQSPADGNTIQSFLEADHSQLVLGPPPDPESAVQT